MEQTLARFVRALRNADVVVSPAEALDALAVMQQVGITNRDLLRHALSLALAKTPADKIRFDVCFERFFTQLYRTEKPKRSLLASFDHQAVSGALAGGPQTQARDIATMVLGQQTSRLNWALQEAANLSGIGEMRALRDKNRVMERMGQRLALDAFDEVQRHESGDAASGAAYVKRYVKDQARRFVDLHYELSASTTARQQLIVSALDQNLARVSPGYLNEVEHAVHAFADQLRRKTTRRRRKSRYGMLDVRRMLRRNLAFDGHLFHLHWRSVQKRPGKLFVMCDVSGSVASVARFLLLLLHRLDDALPDVRTFAFSNRLGEVTQQFARSASTQAIDAALFDWGHGNTDYGRAFLDFRAQVGRALDNRATLIVLGDARNNYYDARVNVFESLARRSREVIWLNPEPRGDWGSGDSVMNRYAPFCTHLHRLSNLTDLKRFTTMLVNAQNA